jgi:hypothetical protein
MRRVVEVLAVVGLMASALLGACSEADEAAPVNKKDAGAVDGGGTVVRPDSGAVVPSAPDGSAEDAATQDEDSGPEDAGTDAPIPCDASVNGCSLSTRHTCSNGYLQAQACSMGCANGKCNTTCASPTVAVAQEQADDQTNLIQWQSFELSKTGVLTAVELRPNVFSDTGDPFNLTLSIYVGEGVAGTRIAEETYVVPSASGGPFRTFTLTVPVPIQAGQRYTLELTGAKGLYYATTNVYADGRTNQANYDVAFRLHFGACE